MEHVIGDDDSNQCRQCSVNGNDYYDEDVDVDDEERDDHVVVLLLHLPCHVHQMFSHCHAPAFLPSKLQVKGRIEKT